MHDPMTADVDTEVSANEKDQTRVTIVKVSTEGTEKDDDGNTIDLTDEEKAQKKDLAQQVLDKVKASDDVANADMDALAKEVDDSLSATAPAFTTAGDTDDTLDEAVQDAALELKDGEVADKVIEGDDGYYVVRLDKMLDEDATENKEKTVISERKSDLYDSTLEDWVKEEKIKVKDKVWDQITVTDSVSLYTRVPTAAMIQNPVTHRTVQKIPLHRITVKTLQKTQKIQKIHPHRIAVYQIQPQRTVLNKKVNAGSGMCLKKEFRRKVFAHRVPSIHKKRRIQRMSVVQWTTGIQHIGIPTSDIETTIRFYEGLGFQTMHTNQVPANKAKVAFLQLGNLMIETYAEGGNGLDGAINHFALNCTDIQAAYTWICEHGYKVLSDGIEELPFWENGVAFFIIEGPNKERIEFCQRK